MRKPVPLRTIAKQILAHEGGYVDDPDDRGGATSRGITIGTLRGLGIDINNDGVIDTDDLRELTEEQAIDIYIEHYALTHNVDKVDPYLQASLFDQCIHSGYHAGKLLQRMINEMEQEQVLKVDGGIGGNTVKAANRLAAKDPELFNDCYCIARRNRYLRIGDNDPSQQKYIMTRARGKGGWVTRAEFTMRPEYRLTDAEWAEEISEWADL